MSDMGRASSSSASRGGFGRRVRPRPRADPLPLVAGDREEFCLAAVRFPVVFVDEREVDDGVLAIVVTVEMAKRERGE